MMQKGKKEIRVKIVLEGAKAYKKDVEEIRKTAERAKMAVDELNTSLGQLSESIKEFAELREKLF